MMSEADDDGTHSRAGKKGKVSGSLETRKLPVEVPQTSNDDGHLLNIFPEELWVITLESIQDPDELENCAKSSPFFLRLLEPRCVEYLFPKVVPILINWCRNNVPDEDSESDDWGEFNSDDDNSEDDNEQDEDKDQEMEVRRRSREKLKIEPLRLVCHCWCKAVESYMLNHPSNFQINGVSMKELKFKEGEESDSDFDSDSEDGAGFDLEGTERNEYLKCFKAEDALRVDHFIEKFDCFPDKNPLFHRKLIIQDPSRWNVSKEQVRSLWQSVTLFLQKFGQHIWFCEIRIRNNITGFSYYFKVREWLELMGNLKVLLWAYPITWIDLEDSEGYEFGSRFPIFLKCKLEDKVRENPLPKLEHLQVFKTDDLPYPIFREFIKRNDHISKVQFHRKFPPPPQYEDFYEYDFANGLHSVTDLSMILWRKKEIQELETSASTSSWPLLQKLSVHWGDYNVDYGYNKWSQIFNVIEKKCKDGVLTNLTLSLPNPVIPSWKTSDEKVLQSPAGLNLNLPQVRILKIILPKEDTTLDFLLPMKESLEDLQVILKCERPCKRKALASTSTDTTDDEQTIQFKGYHGRMLKSNIWSIFPKLLRIVLTLCYDDEGRRIYRYDRERLVR